MNSHCSLSVTSSPGPEEGSGAIEGASSPCSIRRSPRCTCLLFSFCFQARHTRLPSVIHQLSMRSGSRRRGSERFTSIRISCARSILASQSVAKPQYSPGVFPQVLQNRRDSSWIAGNRSFNEFCIDQELHSFPVASGRLGSANQRKVRFNLLRHILPHPGQFVLLPLRQTQIDQFATKQKYRLFYERNSQRGNGHARNLPILRDSHLHELQRT